MCLISQPWPQCRSTGAAVWVTTTSACAGTVTAVTGVTAIAAARTVRAVVCLIIVNTADPSDDPFNSICDGCPARSRRKVTRSTAAEPAAEIPVDTSAALSDKAVRATIIVAPDYPAILRRLGRRGSYDNPPFQSVTSRARLGHAGIDEPCHRHKAVRAHGNPEQPAARFVAEYAVWLSRVR